MFERIINDISRQIRSKIEMANDKTGVLTQFTKDEARKDIAEYEHAIAVLKSSESATTAPNNARGEICEWKLKNDTYYHTTCGEIVQSILDIEGMKFCPYCSRKLSPVA